MARWAFARYAIKGWKASFCKWIIQAPFAWGILQTRNFVNWKLSWNYRRLFSAIKAYAYAAYIVLGGAFYGVIAGFVGWLVDRRSRGTQTEQVISK